MYNIRSMALASAVVAASAFSASADSIDPESFSATLEVGESTTIEKTVTIDAGRPDSARLDVMFLVDTTGSMGGVIGSVRTNASAILSELSGFGDVQFGVAEYRDIFDSTTYRVAADLTDDTADVQTGINSLFASGGNDEPEFNMGGLTLTAEDTAWRDDSTRIVVWFGDAPGHDPRIFDGTTYTEAGALAALAAEDIIVHAVDSSRLDSTGQATRITDATGGEIFDVASSGAGVADAIIDAIDTTFDTYSTVDLALSGDSSCVDVDISEGYAGDFDRETSRDFTFDVTFTGATPGTCDFQIAALIDGGAVAFEDDSITVTGGTPVVPLPASLPLLAGALAFGGFMSRRKK
ncbi:VWA domain-containing protein [Litoreibacter roseus]|uniref:VWFA domain-containing protein n=1 Tax=Litoreibacter roseus TaxID=2601869 RepID=A0A6N6JHI5_9RHOB|nr:VWA domain-containing protein [Litoreibacter roseus]GFE65823.1 hypothetical protein KIN_28970 [Litoreibacter roseus]